MRREARRITVQGSNVQGFKVNSNFKTFKSFNRVAQFKTLVATRRSRVEVQG
jgi:hypothetical protein